jgi:hypothetical protein
MEIDLNLPQIESRALLVKTIRGTTRKTLQFRNKNNQIQKNKNKNKNNLSINICCGQTNSSNFHG